MATRRLRQVTTWLALGLGALMISFELPAAPPVADDFGTSSKGNAVQVYTLSNDHGITVRVMTRGATIVDLQVPDREGRITDVVLGFDDLAGYESSRNAFFGCTTGRVANRIARGRFTIDGAEYQVATNASGNHIHGGKERSLDKVIWSAEPQETPEGQAVLFRYTSPDGEEGYPGTLQCSVRFLVRNDRNELVTEYEARTDKPTPVNLTNHTYFNLAGQGADTVLDHELQLFAEKYTLTDDDLIPTGELAAVEGTPLDFRQPHTLGERIAELDSWAGRGYDHNFVIDGAAGASKKMARLSHPQSGRVLEVYSTQPGVQLYTGNHLKGQAGKGGKTYPRRSGVCLETQHFPDSVNHPEFPDSIVRPGEPYRQTCRWVFGVE